MKDLGPDCSPLTPSFAFSIDLAQIQTDIDESVRCASIFDCCDQPTG